MIVNCLLPSKIRRLGRRSSYLVPRQPIRTTAANCRIRGGEYTEPDQANLATALKVWLPQAKAGDKEAQYYVGRIFEQGLGVGPDYESAATWYRKAAEQGYAAAQINLGHLYEEGLGVEQDGVAALNWYRQAAGLAEDLIVLEESEYDELVRERNELGQERQEADKLRREVDELRRQLEELESEAEEGSSRQATLESVLERLQGEFQQQKVEVARREELIAKLEERLSARPEPAEAEPGRAPTGADIAFGSYHALVIGNRNYQELPDIETAEKDAREFAELMRTKYGFEVQVLIDATRYQTMTALNDLREALTPENNLLVYYAGHGRRDETTGLAYWQPVDAEHDSPANWIPSEVVTEHLDLVPAKHVLVVADSVYSGLRARSSLARLSEGMTEDQRFHHLRTMMERRSRLVLTSGGERPAADADGGHSRFSSALLEVLKSNEGVLEASKVYRQVNDRLYAASGGSTDQVPEFSTMRWARNNVADFFFVPGS